jgi:microcystin-dependent protein
LADFWDASTGDLAQLLSDFQPILNFALDNLECGAMDIPIGSIMLFAGGTLPDKWLLCDGQAVAQNDYPELYQAIGDAYFPGGIGIFENFYLPDLRGRVPVGRDITQSEFDLLGEKGGEKTHTLSITEMPSHNHQLGYGANRYSTGTNPDIGYSLTGWHASVTNYTGGGGAHNNLQPYLVTNFIIRALK